MNSTPEEPRLAFLQTTLLSIASILAAMAALSLLEALSPLRARGAWNRAHLGPNLALTFITFAANAVFGSALVLALEWMHARELGLIPWLALPPSLLRFAAIAAFALPLGASSGAFALYRVLAALSGLLEHANFRLPLRLEAALSRVVTWPAMHKIHHSRDARVSDSNYGNIVSIWDRCFGTFTHPREARNVSYGLDGFDAPAAQTAGALLAEPFRSASAGGEQQLSMGSPN